jgi:HK97 family phage major capsid protein
MPTKTQDLAGAIKARRESLRKLFDDHKTPEGYNLDKAQLEHVNAECKALDDLQEQYEAAATAEQADAANRKALDEMSRVRRPSFKATGGDGATLAGGNGEDATKSLGQLFAERAYYEGAAVKNQAIELPWDAAAIKTTMTTAAGFAPENFRSGRVVLSAQRPISILDMLPMIQVGLDNNAYVYMAESTFTNNAAEIAENDSTGAPESALAYTETSESIRRVATFLPVTDEQLADVTGMQGLIDNRLSYMVRLKLESQVVAGNGSTPNINGFLNRVTQSQAKSTDPVFDAIFKGMIKVMHTGYANPTAMVCHPNDWQDIRLTRTTDGIYIMGNPDQPGPERLFGLPVVVTTAETENTVLVGDFLGFSALVYKTGVEVETSNSHSDYFIKYLRAVRVSIRAALAVFRLTAFCKVTGM